MPKSNGRKRTGRARLKDAPEILEKSSSAADEDVALTICTETKHALGVLPIAPTDKGLRAVFVSEDVPASEGRRVGAKGYYLIDVRVLPRRTEDEHRTAIEGWLQGMAEGTIPYSEERLEVLDREIKVHGLVINKSQRLTLGVSADKQTVEDLLAAFSTKRAMRKITLGGGAKGET